MEEKIEFTMQANTENNSERRTKHKYGQQEKSRSLLNAQIL